jgi:hypothetical protein
MSGQTQQLVQNAAFTHSLSQISFYLSDELTDDWLALLMTQHNLVLTKISLVYCSQISDRGVMCLTNGRVAVISTVLGMRAFEQTIHSGSSRA